MTPPNSLLLQFLLTVFASSTVWAQQDGKSNPKTSTSSKVWSAIAFINHGETTPFLLNKNPVLTPDGAQQLYRQGSAFRERYLNPSAAKNGSETGAPIQNLSQNALDNAQLRILSQTDSWVAGGAVAFMQGLYPPNDKALNAAAGGQTLAENHVGGSSNTTSYPLNGYQYPQIQTLPMTDASSIGIQGHVGCPAWQSASTTNLTTNPTLKDAAQQSTDFYTQLFASGGPLEGMLYAADANFFNAYDIYNLVQYEYTRNATVSASLRNVANATLARLAGDAFTMERAKSDPGSSTANDTASIALSIAGRTLAAQVAQQMAYNANSSTTAGDQSRQLTLLFGSFQPLMAFFSIAGLLSRDNVLSTPLGNVTAPGAAIVFELIGQDARDASKFPKPTDLSVRFLYRATADATDAFQVYSLFGSGVDGRSIPYLAFMDKMNARGKDAADWCQVCKPGAAAVWCQNVLSSGSKGQNNGGGSHMKPAVAGVIGALIMGAIIAIGSLALCGLGGFRLQRRAGRGSHGRGAEKKPDDQDVQYGSGGHAHERIGSWELRDNQNKTGSEVHRQDLQAHPQQNPFDDDSASDIGAVPVKVRDTF